MSLPANSNNSLISLKLPVFFLLLSATTVSAELGSVAIVKLYADGKVVNQWEAIDKGKMEGPCYVFHVKNSIYESEVRVCGTFSVEDKR